MAFEKFWVRRPAIVYFAGFESDTYKLQRSGWQISANQDYMRAAVRLALKFEPASLFAMTNVVDFRDVQEHMMSMRFQDDAPKLIFEIQKVFVEGRVHFTESRGIGQWKAIDATPEMLFNKEIRFEDFVPFRPVNCDKEIFIPQKSIPELLDHIMTLQEPKQAEIRERERKERWKEANGLLGEGYHPERDIKCQILSVA